MRPNFSISVLIFLTTVMLAGCTKDVNLARDVDLLLESASPTPYMAQNSMTQNNQIQQQMQQAAPPIEPTSTPIPAAPIEETVASPATVSSSVSPITVDLTTSEGVIQIALSPKDAPNTVKNFLEKARSGYYQNLTFHRVENWVIQGGDPEGTGRGGGTIPTELSQTPFKEGSVGVARGGDIMVSNDSQFFICTSDCSWLTGQYTLFGEVTSGMDVAKRIKVGSTILSITEVSP